MSRNNNSSLPRSSSYSSRSIGNNNWRSDSISANPTLSSSLSTGRGSSIMQNNQQQHNNMISSSYNEYNRPPSSYYSSTTSDYDGRYQQPLPDIPTSPTDSYYSNNNPNAISPRLGPYNRPRIVSPTINTMNRNYEVDTRNTYVDEQIPGGKINPSLSTSTKASSSNNLIFPPTQEMRYKINALLLQTEESFKVVYAGDAVYKPDKGILNKTKRGHFVLTNNHMLLYKNSQKARSEINLFDHGVGETTATSAEKLVDKERIFLKLSNIYAVHAVVTVLYTFRIEYFHSQSSQTLHHILTVDSDKECRQWIQALRKAVTVHHPRISSISSTERYNVIDRLTKQSDNFLNSDHINIYKVVFKEKRYKAGSDTPKEIFLPVIFAIGRFSFYFLPASIMDDEYLKMVERDRFGLLSIQSIKYENVDDTIVLEVKQVDKNNRQLVFASSFCEEIIQNLQRAADSILAHSPLFTSHVPTQIKNTQIIPYKISMDPEDEITGRDDEEMHQFNTTLRAFTAAMNLNKSRFNYSMNGPSKSKVFTLLPPNEVGGSPPIYQKYELLAIFRTLQVNVS